MANINADDVWNEFGVTGEGITVANIDTGVQYDHPALVGKYRGNNGDGTFDHNYNWFNAAGSCSTAPCDTNGHGTHTMGTMLGDDGAANQIGVAPGAKWIAANGCCPSDAALISSGQWMLAPTDLDGENPDTTKRPNIVNNSWGTQRAEQRPVHGGHPDRLEGLGHLRHLVQRQQRAVLRDQRVARQPDHQLLGRRLRQQQQHRRVLLPRRGPGRRDQAEHQRSGRQRPVQPARQHVRRLQRHLDGGTAPRRRHRPALVGSAVPGGRHRRDLGAARRHRRSTAARQSAAAPPTTTTSSAKVAWTPWPCSRPHRWATPARSRARSPMPATGDPIEGAEVELVGESSRTLTTGEDGTYSVRLTAGEYTVTASAYGYETQTATVTVTAGETVTQDFALATAPMGTVVGSVSDGSGHDWPLYSKLTVEGAAPDGFSDPSTGEFSLSLPVGTYSVTVDAEYPGYVPETREITVDRGPVDPGLRARGGQHHVHGARLHVHHHRHGDRGLQRRRAARGLDDRGQHRATARCGASTTRTTGAT